MKFLFLPVVLWGALGAACLAEPPALVTGKDIAPIVKLVVRAEKREELTLEEKDKVAVMVAYLKGFADGLHPMQILFPQGPVAIPESVSVGDFARAVDSYLDANPEALKDPSSLCVFNAAFAAFKNPNFTPELMPRRVPVPELKTKP